MNADKLSELEAAAIERHLLNLIKRMDCGKGVEESDLEDKLLWTPLNSLLDKGLIYEPIMGVVKCLT